MVRIRKKLLLTASLLIFSILLFIYFLNNLSSSTENPVGFQYKGKGWEFDRFIFFFSSFHYADKHSKD